MMRTITTGAALLALLTLTATAAADDRIAMGHDIRVAHGDRVDDVFSMGGDVVIDGTAEGDVVSMGGDVAIRGRVEGDVGSAGGNVRIDGVVEGDVATAGGRVSFGPDGRVEGDVDASAGAVGRTGHGGGWRDHASLTGHGGIGGFFRRLGAFALLFLLAFAFRALATDRFHTVRAAMVRAPVKAPLVGLAFFCAAVVAILGSAITVVGIPLAAVLAVGLVLATYVGLAMTAAVLGAVLPFERLKGRDNAQLAAGVGVLFFASLVPFFGGLTLVLATLFGLGAVALTRVGQRPLTPVGEGPYR